MESFKLFDLRGSITGPTPYAPASLGVGVECYAGHRGEQTPRTLILGGRRIAVADLLDAWLAPDYRYFKLRGADDDEDNVSNLLVGSQVVPAFPERYTSLGSVPTQTTFGPTGLGVTDMISRPIRPTGRQDSPPSSFLNTPAR